MKPVFVDRDRSNGTWGFAFRSTPVYGSGVEHYACKLLAEQLFAVLAQKYGRAAWGAVHAEKLCDELESKGVRTIHGAIIECYRMLANGV